MKAETFGEVEMEEDYKYLSNAAKVLHKWSGKYGSLEEAGQDSSTNRSFIDKLIHTMNGLFGIEEIVQEGDLGLRSYRRLYDSK